MLVSGSSVILSLYKNNEATSLCGYLRHEFLRKVTQFGYSVCDGELKGFMLKGSNICPWLLQYNVLTN